MVTHSGKYPVFAIACLLVLSVTGTRAQAQGGYELRCRGRGGAFAIDRIDASMVSLRFTASPRAAGAEGAGLDPGTCAWIDRAVNSAEPLLIHFTADASQATSISQQLDDPGNYWTFFVNNTNQGYFDAKSHNAWSKAQTTKADVTARTTNADVTARRAPTTSADITARRPGLDPSAGVARPAIDKQTYKDEDLRLPIITDVRAVPTAQNVTISFTSISNAVPLVEIAQLSPVKGADRHWRFPTMRPRDLADVFMGVRADSVPFASGVITRPAGGDQANGKYTVDMNQELDPGVTYFYIINVKSDNNPGAEIRQVTGQFRMPGSNSYQVRYRGFFSQETTTGPEPDEIYAIVSISFVYPSGGPATFTGTHPAGVVKGVGNNETHGDPGRMVYQGGPVNLLLTVTLMEHDFGNPDQYKTEIHDAVLKAVGLVLIHPGNLGSAINTVSNAVRGALGAGDDVIGTTSRLITAAEMKFMANGEGFATEHRGHGGIYRVHFDIISQ